MRTLILLCLLAPVAWGQEMTREQAERMVQPVIRSDIQNMAIQEWIAAKKQEAVRDSLVSWWDQYRAECWGDSVRVDRVADYRLNDPAVCSGSYDDSTVTVYWSEMVRTMPRYYYRHTLPAFEGFMEFLRRNR